MSVFVASFRWLKYILLSMPSPHRGASWSSTTGNTLTGENYLKRPQLSLQTWTSDTKKWQVLLMLCSLPTAWIQRTCSCTGCTSHQYRRKGQISNCKVKQKLHLRGAFEIKIKKADLNSSLSKTVSHQTLLLSIFYLQHNDSAYSPHQMQEFRGDSKPCGCAGWLKSKGAFPTEISAANQE